MDEVAALDLKNSLIHKGSPSKKTPLKKTAFLLTYLSVIPGFIVFLILITLSLKYEGNGYISRQEHSPQYQALPSQNSFTASNFEHEDARSLALEEIFKRYDSPLQGLGNHVVTEADKHNIDYRLLPAIAMQESTLCKKIIKNSYNCWGWGIYGTTVTKFESYEKAISYISERLSVRYVQKGYTTPEQIVQKYTPSDDGKWSSVVSLMMDRIANEL